MNNKPQTDETPKTKGMMPKRIALIEKGMIDAGFTFSTDRLQYELQAKNHAAAVKFDLFARIVTVTAMAHTLRIKWTAAFSVEAPVEFIHAAIKEATKSLRPYLGDSLGEIIGWAAVVSAILYAVFFIHLPRCRSLGLPGGALVILILPPVNVLLVLLFLFGSEGLLAPPSSAATVSTQNPK